MGHRPHYKSGLHLFLCQQCGFVKHSDKKKMRWDGLITCDKCWEPRHPQEFKRPIIDDPSVENPASEPTDVFITTAITRNDL